MLKPMTLAGVFACVFTLVFTLAPERAAAWPQFANETGAECSFCHNGPPANKMFTQQGKEFQQYLINQGRLPGCKKVPVYDAAGNYMGEMEQCS